MKRSNWIRILAVTAVSLALAAGAVGALASTRDSGSSSPDTAPQQEQATNSTAWLGILAHPAKDREGVVVGHVAPDSPADSAGLDPGDVIKAIDGTDAQDVEDLRDAIDDKAPGDKVTLSIVKNGVEDEDAQPENVEVTLAARPEDAGAMGMPGEMVGKAFGRFLGGSFKYLDDDDNEVEIEAVPGTVKSYDDSKITIDVNGDEGDRTFDIPEDEDAPDELAEGDNVTVMLEGRRRPGRAPGGFGFGGMPFGHGGGMPLATGQCRRSARPRPRARPRALRGDAIRRRAHGALLPGWSPVPGPQRR